MGARLHNAPFVNGKRGNGNGAVRDDQSGHNRQLSPRVMAFGVTPNDRRPTLENPSGVLHRGG